MSDFRPLDSANCVSISVYDLEGRFLRTEPMPPARQSDAAGPPGAPCWAETLEFRLGRRGEHMVLRDLDCVPRSGGIASVRTVRAYVLRAGETVLLPTIGGIHVDVSLEHSTLVCTAKAEDFAKGEQVVVQADVAVYGRNTN